MFKLFNTNPYPVSIGKGLSMFVVPAHGNVKVKDRPKSIAGVFVQVLSKPVAAPVTKGAK